MKGDKLVIEAGHGFAARRIAELLSPHIAKTRTKVIVTIAGESGSGKSEIAAALAELLAGMHVTSTILQQDDYFVYPPKTNAALRRKDIAHVGLSEVQLALLDQHLKDILGGRREIQKPLVDFDGDRIATERMSLEGIKTVIVEGTYTTILENVHERVFIDRTYRDTRETRRRRAREEQDAFLEEILGVEHDIISSHKRHASILVTKDYEVRQMEGTKS